MANAPQVQTLAQIMADLAPGVQSQQQVIAQQQQGLGAKYDALRSGLDAKKVQGFNKINDQATGKGTAFSGMPIDEQATYLSTDYLPKVADANAQQIQDNLSLAGKSADISAGVYKDAFNRQSQQASDLNSWNMSQAQIEASAREAAANRAANAPKVLSPQDAALSIINGAVSAGADISANVFQLARDAYRRAGGDTGTFASDFWKYVPQSANEDNSTSGWKSYYYG